MSEGPVGPVDATKVPRYAGPPTFARLPRLDEVGRADVAVLGVPFDSGVSYRPGSAVRAVAHPAVVAAAAALQPGAGRARRSPSSRWPTPATSASTRSTSARRSRPSRPVPRQRWRARRGCSRSAATTPSRCPCCAASRVGTARSRCCTSTRTSTRGTRTSARRTRTARRSAARPRRGSSTPGGRCTSASAGRCTASTDLEESTRLGYATVACTDYDRLGLDGVIEAMRERLGDGPVYVSVDIDVIDPGMAPGTGTPEAGGLTSRELLATLPRLGWSERRVGRHRRGRAGVRPRRGHRHRRRPRRV